MKSKAPEEPIALQRYLLKRRVEDFAYDKTNPLDGQLAALITDNKKAIKAAFDDLDKMDDQQQAVENEDPEVSYSIRESLKEAMYDTYQSAEYLQEQLLALFETKIIYAFKSLEINIKHLLNLAYKDKVTKFGRWDDIGQFLALKDISISTIENYKEIDDLKKVNNALKHSDKALGDKLKDVAEFKNKQEISHAELELFYERIKDAPDKFLKSLVSAVQNDLFSFDVDRLSEISKSYALRMDKSTALAFSESLMKLYE